MSEKTDRNQHNQAILRLNLIFLIKNEQDIAVNKKRSYIL